MKFIYLRLKDSLLFKPGIWHGLYSSVHFKSLSVLTHLQTQLHLFLFWQHYSKLKHLEYIELFFYQQLTNVHSYVTCHSLWAVHPQRTWWGLGCSHIKTLPGLNGQGQFRERRWASFFKQFRSAEMLWIKDLCVHAVTVNLSVLGSFTLR